LSLQYQPSVDDLERLIDQRELLVQSRTSTFQIDREIERIRNEIDRTVIDGPRVRLLSGNYFDFSCPEQSTFTITDIATALSRIPRFNGQTPRHYSVAQHSVHVSRIVPKEHALAGLMHDASEAFMGDLAAPLKSLLPDYCDLEHRVQRAIFDRFNIAWPMPDSIKRADLVMLRTEQRDVLDSDDIWAPTQSVQPLAWRLPEWGQTHALMKFVQRFKELTYV